MCTTRQYSRLTTKKKKENRKKYRKFLNASTYATPTPARPQIPYCPRRKKRNQKFRFATRLTDNFGRATVYDLYDRRTILTYRSIDKQPFLINIVKKKRQYNFAIKILLSTRVWRVNVNGPCTVICTRMDYHCPEFHQRRYTIIIFLIKFRMPVIG